MATISVRGIFGPLAYEREAHSDGMTLKVPFQRNTYEIKEGLKDLGFRCIYDERYWQRTGATEGDETALHRLLSMGDAYAGPPAPAGVAVTAIAAEAGAPAPGSPAAGAPTRTPAQRGERRRREEEEAPARCEQRFVGGQVLLRPEADGHAVLDGAPLQHIWQQLERVLHFTRQPTIGGVPRRFRSGFPLNDREWAFLVALLEHRTDKMVDGSLDDKTPLPPEMPLPPRFRPRDGEGLAMQGPRTTRQGGNGKPWNWGRQFFASSGASRQGDLSTFLWADGTQPFEDEAQERAVGYLVDEMPPGFGQFMMGGVDMGAFGQLMAVLEGTADPGDMWEPGSEDDEEDEDREE